MRAKLIVLLFALLVCAQAQQAANNPRSIIVSATDSASAEADVAIVKVGYNSFGATREEAMSSNWEHANAITKALTAAGIPAANIVTMELRVSQLYDDDKVIDQVAKGRKFVMNHKWAIRAPVADAAKVLKISVQAGANVIEGVEWQVSDPIALESRAAGMALKRSREIAKQMAAGMGVRLGRLLKASNRAEDYSEGEEFGGDAVRFGGGIGGGIGGGVSVSEV